MSDSDNLPSREEYIEGYHEHRKALVDCVNKNTWDEDAVKDAPATPEGMARKVFGKPFDELSRNDQNMIRKVYAGHVKEAAENIKALRRNNLLSALQRVDHAAKWLQKMEPIIEAQFEMFNELQTETVGKDNAYRNQDFHKTTAGNAVAQLKHINRMQTMIDRHIQSSERITKMEEKASVTIVREGDKNLTVNNITPEDVRGEFAEFVEGGESGQIGIEQES